MSKRLWFLLICASLVGIAAFFCFSEDPKKKQGVHDEESYVRFCQDIISQPDLYRNFRAHPLYGVFQESLNEESAKGYLHYIEQNYPDLLLDRELISALDAIGSPPTIPLAGQGEISYPTLRNLKIAGDMKKFFGSLTGKTVVQIGASDGALCKILQTLHRPGRYCIVDIPPALALAKKTLADWGIHDVEFVTIEEFVSPPTIDVVISPYVFTESPRNIQKLFLSHIVRHAHQGYLDSRFPMRHFGLKVWQPQQIMARLQGIGKEPRLLQEEPLTDIDHCQIIF